MGIERRAHALAARGHVKMRLLGPARISHQDISHQDIKLRRRTPAFHWVFCSKSIAIATLERKTRDGTCANKPRIMQA